MLLALTCCSPQSDADDDSGSESEFEAEPEDVSDSDSASESVFDGSDASDDTGSASTFDSENESGESNCFAMVVSSSQTDPGEDWDELERKAAKCLCFVMPDIFYVHH